MSGSLTLESARTDMLAAVSSNLKFTVHPYPRHGSDLRYFGARRHNTTTRWQTVRRYVTADGSLRNL